MAHTEDLPIPDYDQLSLGDLQHRIRALGEDQLIMVRDHERAHGGRMPMLEAIHERLLELQKGGQPSGGDPGQTPNVEGRQGSSPVQEKTAAEPNTPLRHGVAGQTPARGRP